MTRPPVLFLQVTDPALYPPLINAAWILSKAGYRPVLLSSPHAENRLLVPNIPHAEIDQMPLRRSFVVSKSAYLAYTRRATALACKLKPAVVYASDPIGALPGLLAARLSGADLIYHEHDSPNDGNSLNSLIGWARKTALARSALTVFPNAARAHLVQQELGLSPQKFVVAWNVPRRDEIQSTPTDIVGPFKIYYHGSINPDRLPLTVLEAVGRLRGKAILRIAGYETASGSGYVARLIERFGQVAQGGLIEYLGQVPRREDLLTQARSADVGLALMPTNSEDINMQHMAGASNKAFDYMASGLPIIVSDLPEWRSIFVEPGHALAANPNDAASLECAIRQLMDDAPLRRVMASRNRSRMVNEWNYETEFAPILRTINSIHRKI